MSLSWSTEFAFGPAFHQHVERCGLVCCACQCIFYLWRWASAYFIFGGVSVHLYIFGGVPVHLYILGCQKNLSAGAHRTVFRRTVSREQFLSNSRAWRTTSRRTTSRRTTSRQRLARTAKTNLESLLLECLLLHLCVLARAKGSLHKLCGERVLLRVIDTLRFIGFGLPSTNQAQGEYTRSITEPDSLAKSVDSQFRVAGPHTQFVTSNTIHMRCSHHTH